MYTQTSIYFYTYTYVHTHTHTHKHTQTHTCHVFTHRITKSARSPFSFSAAQFTSAQTSCGPIVRVAVPSLANAASDAGIGGARTKYSRPAYIYKYTCIYICTYI